MGIVPIFSSPHDDSFEREEKVRSLAIERVIQREKGKKQVPLLLLGSQQAGKSTIGKQMKLFFRGYDDFERNQYVYTIRHEIFLNMRKLVLCAENLSIDIEDEQTEIFKKQAFYTMDEEDFAHAVKKLWENQKIRETFEKSEQAGFRIPQTCPYFFKKVDQFLKSDYISSDQDILLSSSPFPEGVSETFLEFVNPETIIRVVDVAQPNCLFRKWIPLFSFSTGVIYVVALDEFDVCIGDSLREYLRYFENIVRLWFNDAPIFLFLNKVDLFEKKIQEKDLSITFPSYKGGKNKDLAIDFIKNQFMATIPFGKENVHVFVTEAIDQKNMELNL